MFWMEDRFMASMSISKLGEKASTCQDTLLATMLDDPQVAPSARQQEIIVEGNKQRFRYILDW